jgi:predicted TIM-barrel fold metal-dependent hydrolase
MHIFSPEAARVLKILCVRAGPAKCPPEISTGASDGQDVVASLDAAGIRNGVLLSTGYFFGSPDVTDLKLDVPAETRAENTFVVGQARAHCGRLLAFISVNPLATNALDEIAYWGREGGATGLKLHLENSGFDFRSPAQVKKLAAVFRAAAREHFPIVVHLETRNDDYGAKDVRIFLKDVAPFARSVPVQIAHAGAGGGVNAHTLSALGAFADVLARDPAGTANLFFDLAMVPDEVSNTAKIKATPEHIAALVGLMHRIGLNRFVPGSDWTTGLNLKPYYDDERAALGLSDSEWDALAANEAPYVKSASERQSCSARL